MSVPTVAALDILRFFRRRSTVWMFAGAGTGVLLAYGLAPFVPLSNPFERDARVGIEIVNRLLVAGQVMGVWAMASTLAKRSLMTEMAAGTLVLLNQTPVPGSRLLLGKAIGAAAVALVGHCFVAAFVLLPTPIIQRPHWVFVLHLMGGWLLAVTFVPSGLAKALAARSGSRRWLRELSSISRFVVPVAVLQLLIVPESRGAGVAIWDVLYQFWQNLIGQMDQSSARHFGGPVVPLVVVAVWFTVMGILDWCRALRLIGR